MIDAYLAAGDYPGAMAELGRYKALVPSDPESPFVEARIHFAAGDVERAAASLRTALDTTEATDFQKLAGNPIVFEDLASAANVFAYVGDLTNATRALDLADRARREVYGGLVSPRSFYAGDTWHRSALGQLYAAVGAPAASLRRVWQSAAEAGRMALPADRKRVVETGGTAAIELFAGTEGDSSAVSELASLTGDSPPREVRALLALQRSDSVAARRMLAEPDTSTMKMGYMVLPASAGGRGVLPARRLSDGTLAAQDFEPACTRGGDSIRAGGCSDGCGCSAPSCIRAARPACQ